YKQAKNTFTLPGLGKLVLVNRPAREMTMQFGPKKGQTVKIPPKRVVKFRVAKAAKDAILGSKQAIPFSAGTLIRSECLFCCVMKIAVVGCGAVGSFYGAKLARAGAEVDFLLRSDYEAVRRQGLLVRSPQGDFRVQPKCARTPEEIGPSELVLIGLKTTANHQYGELIPPLVDAKTVILTLQNG